MKRIIYIYCLLILISCDFSEKKVYKNLYITNGGENQDYNVAAIKLDENNQLNVFPFEVKDYYIDNKYIFFCFFDLFSEKKYYLISKDFDEFNYEKKIIGPLNSEEFYIFKHKENIKNDWK